jgi:hypothetical protein
VSVIEGISRYDSCEEGRGASESSEEDEMGGKQGRVEWRRRCEVHKIG